MTTLKLTPNPTSVENLQRAPDEILEKCALLDQMVTPAPFIKLKDRTNMAPAIPRKCPFELEQLETGEKESVLLSESTDTDKPRHTVGCTPHECHGALMKKNGFNDVSNSYALSKVVKIQEAKKFLVQLFEETGTYSSKELIERLEQVETDILDKGSYDHTNAELDFGCRLAWRNSGRCIMRKVYTSLEVRDCRNVKNSDDCFAQIVEHLRYAQNAGAIKPVISIFAPKKDMQSAPVRIWNRQLLGYAAYRCSDGTTLGDPANLAFTALCVQFGWELPERKSDFDMLPLLISDESAGLESPSVYDLPADTVLEVTIEHPEYDLFVALNLRWYAIPAISNVGVDIGGVYYQTSPFNGWYAITEIARNLLDRQRYNIAEAVAIACDIPQTTLAIWRDDVQLQVHRAILHSFTKHAISVVDHHTASDAFMDFYTDEIKKRKRCPADWVWLVPPAGGSMTSVFHQEMVNFIVKPQYTPQVAMWEEEGIDLPAPVSINTCKSTNYFHFKTESSIYKYIYVFYGSETGTSLRFATRLSSDIGDACIGPAPLDSLPNIFKNPFHCRTLILVLTSTFGRGNPPSSAKKFIKGMEDIPNKSIVNVDFGVFALGSSAYIQTFAEFGYKVNEALVKAGCIPVMKVCVCDELKSNEKSFSSFRELLFNDQNGIIHYKMKDSKGHTSHQIESMIEASKFASLHQRKIIIQFQGCARVVSSQINDELHSALHQNKYESWGNHSKKISRSTDLFSFKLDERGREHLKDLRPGDHIALYPSNSEDTFEQVYRMIQHDKSSTLTHRTKQLKNEYDLVRSVGDKALGALYEMVENAQARVILKFHLENLPISAAMPSIESLVNLLPPGSIPAKWIWDYAPAMEPRFYSIASIFEEEGIVSICQSVVTLPPPYEHPGLASRWLRSLCVGDKGLALFSKTNFHLPVDGSVPVILIGAGSGIAPFRSFWLSDATNPMFLFYGCRNKEDLPFSSEIEQLDSRGRMSSFIAFSRGSEKLYVQNMISREERRLLPLLHNPKTHIYVCGLSKMEIGVRNALVHTMAIGNNDYPGIGVSRATEWLVVKKWLKSYNPEVYGVAPPCENDPMAIFWEEATAKVTRIITGLDRIGVLLPRVEAIRIPDSTLEQHIRMPYLRRYTSFLPVKPNLFCWGDILTGIPGPDREKEADNTVNPFLLQSKSNDAETKGRL